MKKYAVSLYSQFDGSLTMDIVYAESELDACKQFLASEGDNTIEDMQNITSYTGIQDFVFNQDHAIAAIPTSSKTPIAEHNTWPYPANLQ